MKIKVTNILAPDLLDHFLSFTSELQQVLAREFEAFDGGVDSVIFMAVFVVVDDDLLVNEKFAQRHDQGSRFKGLDGSWVNSIEVAVSLCPAEVLKVLHSTVEFERLLLGALLARLERPIKRVPKKFNLERFLQLMRNVISERC